MVHTGFLPSPTNGMGWAASSWAMAASVSTDHFGRAGPAGGGGAVGEGVTGEDPVAGWLIARPTGGTFLGVAKPRRRREEVHQTDEPDNLFMRPGSPGSEHHAWHVRP